jgi:superfamily II DNA helicase RecQ
MARKTLEQLKQEREQLTRRINNMTNAQNKKKREQETHAKIVFGGLLVSHFDSDWTKIDVERLRDYLRQYHNGLIKQVQNKEERTSEEATKDLRRFEKASREAKKGQRKADEQSRDNE